MMLDEDYTPSPSVGSVGTRVVETRRHWTPQRSQCSPLVASSRTRQILRRLACPRRESNSQLKDFKSFASAVGLLGLGREVYVLVVHISCSPVLIMWQLAHLTSHLSSSASNFLWVPINEEIRLLSGPRST